MGNVGVEALAVVLRLPKKRLLSANVFSNGAERVRLRAALTQSP